MPMSMAWRGLVLLTGNPKAEGGLEVEVITVGEITVANLHIAVGAEKSRAETSG